MERKTYAITATGAWLEDVQDAVICDFETGLAEKGKPSSENNLHRAIYNTRPDVRAILHCQPFYATMICVTGLFCPRDMEIIPEVPAYCGRMGWVPYLHPGSQELADAVTKEMETHEIVLVANHGVFAVASSPEALIQRCIFLEFASKCIMTSCEDQYNLISEDQVARLRSEFFKV
jgi:L-fuculose-phosphate aldolase